MIDGEIGGGVLAAGLQGPGCSSTRKKRHLRSSGWQRPSLSLCIFTSLALIAEDCRGRGVASAG